MSFKFLKRALYSILVFSIFFVHVAFANLEKSFSEFYYSSQISSFRCGQNISLFAQKLIAEGYDPKKIQILVLRAEGHPWSFGRVVAVNSRWGNINNGNYHQNWDFHVIALIENKVFDFSFNQTPLVLPMENYLDSMFIPKIPFAINGETFRVRNMGPLYTAEHAWNELQKYSVKVLGVDTQGRQYTIFENLNLMNLISQ